MFWAHPRAGGDGLFADIIPIPGTGSPPRGRGRPGAHVGSIGGPRLTPARAGTASGWCRSRKISRAHPRAGGDGPVNGSGDASPRGSPPRGRGRPRDSNSSISLVRAHPRAGGDGSRARRSTRIISGSPPRGRGRPIPRDIEISATGLTPARAGTAAESMVRSIRPGAHPRAGGDGDTPLRASSARTGSPPRGRGRRQ